MAYTVRMYKQIKKFFMQAHLVYTKSDVKLYSALRML